jgi:hypothetical protein
MEQSRLVASFHDEDEAERDLEVVWEAQRSRRSTLSFILSSVSFPAY